MRWRLPLLVLLCAVGCDLYDEVGVLVGPPCEDQSVRQLHPVRGADDVWVGGIVWGDLACPAPEATLSVSGPTGAIDGEVVLTHGGRQIRFEPAAPLSPAATYLARLDTESGYREWAFVTSTLGAPVVGPMTDRALAAHAWRGGLLSPPGFVDDLLPAIREGLHLVVQVIDEPVADAITLRIGGRLDDGVSSAQDTQDRTWDLIGRWDDPSWAIGPVNLWWELAGFRLLLEGAVLEGTIASDLGSGHGGRLAGAWDTRPADDVLGDGPGSLCARAVAAGGGCAPCQDGVEACLPFDLRDLPAEAWSQLLQPVGD